MIALFLVSFVLFSTASADQSACQLPMVRGPCKALLHRYYYNTQTDSCEEFLYGGCNGNTNNFKTMDDCKNTCGKTATTQSTVSVCTLPKDVGPCDAAFPRYYFNTLTSQCDKFIWGGCLPNENNFETLTMCQSTCMN